MLFRFFDKSGMIQTQRHKGVLKMTPRQKLLAIRLSEKIKKKPAYAKSIGIETKNKNNNSKDTKETTEVLS